jgi:diketogulonate reductase-like aldo/keto reductase
LNWGIQKGHVVIPGAHSLDPKGVQYLNENIKIFDFRLTAEEMKEINKLDFKNRMFN